MSTSRNLSHDQMVREAWGADYNKPDVCYQFGKRKFVSTDKTNKGIYGMRILTGIYVEPMQNVSIMTPRLLTELGEMIGIDQ